MGVGVVPRAESGTGVLCRMNLTNLGLLSQVALEERAGRMAKGRGVEKGPMAGQQRVTALIDVTRLQEELAKSGLLQAPTVQKILCSPSQSLPSPAFFVALGQQSAARGCLMSAIQNGVPEVPPLPPPTTHDVDPTFFDSSQAQGLADAWHQLKAHLKESTVNPVEGLQIDDPVDDSFSLPSPPRHDIYEGLEGELGQPAFGPTDSIDFFGEDSLPAIDLPPLGSGPPPLQDDLIWGDSPSSFDVLYDDYARQIASRDSSKDWHNTNEDIYYR